MSEIINKSIIYKITNKINGKIYIGQTREFYGEKKHGINGRFKDHMKSAFATNTKTNTRIPHLYAAIRKYGKDNFTVECLLKCDFSEIDKREIEAIKEYDSTNKKKGYNISLGGSGVSNHNVKEETRMKISKAQNPEGEMGIKEYYNEKEILIGYQAGRKKKGIRYSKSFTSTKNTPKKNYELAKKWLDDFKSDKLENNPYNRIEKLPKNIHYAKENGKIVGYNITVTRNGKSKLRSVQNKNKSLEELLPRAIEIKEELIKFLSAK